MKIALIGYGKMGRLIEEMALAKGHQITARFSRQLGTLPEKKQDLAQADIALDFSHAAGVIPHLELCLLAHKPLVIGTTGWEEQYGHAQEMVKKAKGSCLYAPNFSIGIYLFQHIVAYTASLLQPFNEYDVCGIECHHRQKLDAPSGTAKALSQNLLHHMPRLKNFSFSSVRCGSMPGTHTLHFESSVDTLTLTHQAYNRQGFAQGALLAAEWLLNREGFFSIDDMMRDHLGDNPPCN
jgi:4-hydroxy-tetrahydrodipicolinate reductase